MASKKKSRRNLLGAAIATVMVLFIASIFMMSQQPTGQATGNNQPAGNQIISQPQQQQMPQAGQPATPRDAKCKSLGMDFDTCMLFLDKLCFSNSDCGPFTCQGNKCVP